MFKWLKTEFKSQRQYEIILTLIIGLLVGFVMGGTSSDWAIVKGARWWEVFTAIGTVGATVVALCFGLISHQSRKLELDRRRKVIALNLAVTLQEVENAYNPVQTCFFSFSMGEQMGNTIPNLDAGEMRTVIRSLGRSKDCLLKMSFDDASLIQGLIQSINLINSDLNDAERLMGLVELSVNKLRGERASDWVKESREYFYSAVNKVSNLKNRAELIVSSN